MHERLNFGLKLSFLGNILFIAFGVICFIFYKTYQPGTFLTSFLTFLAYTDEIAGFALLLMGDWLMATSMRFRTILKAAWTFYIILEAVMMVLELNSYKIEAYKPYSLKVAIIHSVISGFVCLSFLQFEKDNKKLESKVILCISMMFAGMLGNILGIRVYFSIIVNALAFVIMFQSIRSLVKHGDIEIDCHGDRARVAEYKSEFVDD
ncbi:hypothetical protein [Ruminococcus sp.]|uniref:hypothetical protein n=1 Tax=Ruminococcus sp. TaxID=41978 RepID=UPI0025D66854|nr:hypothetical protein [Ruminococcus sp.]